MEPTTKDERDKLKSRIEYNKQQYHSTTDWEVTLLRLLADIDRLEARVAELEADLEIERRTGGYGL